MRLNLFLILSLILTLAVSTVLIIGCGDDDDDDDDSSSGDDDDNAGGNIINAFVHDFQTKGPVQGAVVELIQNDTGEPFDPPIKVTSPSSGEVTLQIPEGVEMVGVKCTKSGYHDTYQYYFPAGLTDDEFLIVSRATSSLVALALQITLDPTMGHFAGGIYWGDAFNEDPVGCSYVETDPANNNIHYMGLDDLPTLARDLTGDVPINGQGANPSNGYWVAMNFPVGDGTATAYSGEYESSVYVPKVTADAICITNIYFSKDDFTSDPQEDWCTM